MTRVAWVEVVMGERWVRRVSERAPRVVDETCMKRFSPGFYTLSVARYSWYTSPVVLFLLILSECVIYSYEYESYY